MKQKFFTGLAVIAAIILISGLSIMATASPGTGSDPLITLTYLNGPFRTLINGDINAARTALQNEVNTRAAAIETRVNTELANAQNNPANVFRTVSVSSATPLVLSSGSEIILRTGSATFSTSGGSMVKYSGSPTDEVSGSLIANNMYLATGTVTISGTATLFVRTATALPAATSIDDLDDLELPTCEDCGFIFCMCLVLCEDCGFEPCVCVETCENCEEDPCVCD